MAQNKETFSIKSLSQYPLTIAVFTKEGTLSEHVLKTEEVADIYDSEKNREAIDTFLTMNLIVIEPTLDEQLEEEEEE